MTEPRLTALVEASSLIRRASANGDFAAILRKGDPERGSLIIVVRSKGDYVAVLERALGVDGIYRWERTGPKESDSSQNLADFLNRRAGFDPDLWLIELDIAQAERFIAETTSSG
ncbi:DUF1491 family protein [Sphingomonas sabuli]|uniref:DUF1491 family protein n=1 Tax=Sphingomonas sabuli TaxID=2764186 RepID=A0A7G9L0F7_9SPHN|nr:DUF1491 family protein [Sphingomonas sabuli]QNM82106.1 DUF1491 family protein [Sphingomonas sabuli]